MTTPVGPYTSVVRAGDLLFVSGQIGIVDGSLAEGGFGAQAAQALRWSRGGRAARHVQAGGRAPRAVCGRLCRCRVIALWLCGSVALRLV